MHTDVLGPCPVCIRGVNRCTVTFSLQALTVDLPRLMRRLLAGALNKSKSCLSQGDEPFRCWSSTQSPGPAKLLSSCGIDFGNPCSQTDRRGAGGPPPVKGKRPGPGIDPSTALPSAVQNLSAAYLPLISEPVVSRGNTCVDLLVTPQCFAASRGGNANTH